jgi:hypothetical protein
VGAVSDVFGCKAGKEKEKRRTEEIFIKEKRMAGSELDVLNARTHSEYPPSSKKKLPNSENERSKP